MRNLVLIAAGLALTACASGPKAPKVETLDGLTCQAAANVPRMGPAFDWSYLPVAAEAVDLGGDAYGDGPVRFAGGLVLTGAGAGDRRFGGLSDLKSLGDGRLIATGDEGFLVRFWIRMDEAGRLASAVGFERTPLFDECGRDLASKPRRERDGYNTWADSEGLALLPEGGVLVSFEHEARIWRYGPDGVRGVVSPPFPPEFNSGFETLVWAGEDRFWTAREAGGVWLCAPDLCRPVVEPPGQALEEAGQARLVALDNDPQGRGLFVMRRSFTPETGNVITVGLWTWDEMMAGRDETPLIRLAKPLRVDNFEGLASETRPDGGVRLYLVSDDNFNSRVQQTLLYAFDLE